LDKVEKSGEDIDPRDDDVAKACDRETNERDGRQVTFRLLERPKRSIGTNAGGWTTTRLSVLTEERKKTIDADRRQRGSSLASRLLGKTIRYQVRHGSDATDR
jgi:hypothetical protein